MNETLKGFLQAILFMWCVWWAMVSLSSGYEWNLIDGVLVVGCAVHYFGFTVRESYGYLNVVDVSCISGG